MEAIRNYFKVKLPTYLKSLPLPKTFDGFLELNREEWLELLPLIIMVSILVYLAISPIFGLFNKKQKRPRINKKIMDEDKIKTPFDVEDIGDKKVFCRCWQSNKFPFCDGSHNKHNKETGDNIRPLKIIKKTEENGEKEPEKKGPK